MNMPLPLKDVHPGLAPSWWPPAPGWWVVAGLLLVLAIAAAMWLPRWLRNRRERRRTEATLRRLQNRLATDPSPDALVQLAALLRRAALARFPREQVAALTGGAWLQFLDRTGGEGRFAAGAGRVLATAPYGRALPPELDAAGLVGLVRDWLHHNRRRSTP